MHLQTLFKSQQDKALLYDILNLLFRTKSNEKLAMVMDELLNQHTLGEFFSSTQKALFWIFQHSTKNIPDISIPFLQEYLKQESHKFLVDAYEIDHFLEKCAFQDKKTIITFLEPIALYEEEALKVVEKYIQILANEKVQHIAIDIETIEPKINFMTNNDCLMHLETKFSMILRQALKYSFSSNMPKVVYFVLNHETCTKSLETLKTILCKEEFKESYVGFSFKINSLKKGDILGKIIAFAQHNGLNNGKKITIRIEENGYYNAEHQFEQMVYDVLKKEYEPYLQLIINSNNLYHIELIEALSLKNGLRHMVEIESFMGFSFLAKKSQTLYAPIVCFDDFLNGVEYLLEKLQPPKQKYIFYDFECKNTIFLSVLCHQHESLENILEKIHLVYEKSDVLDLQLLIEEEFFNAFSEQLFKSIKALFRCIHPNAKVEMKDGLISMVLDEFHGFIELKMVKHMNEAIAFIQSQSSREAYSIYTLYEAEEKEFNQRINLEITS